LPERNFLFVAANTSTSTDGDRLPFTALGFQVLNMRRTRTVGYDVVENCLRRTVCLSDGKRYVHQCDRGTYEAVAHAMEDGQPYTGQELSETLDAPFTRVEVAFQFLKDRGVIETRQKRMSYAASNCCFEDAMIEFLALASASTI